MTPDDLHEAKHRIVETSVELLTQQMAEFAATVNLVRKSSMENQQRLGRMTETLGENTAMTSELLDIFKAVKGGFKVLGWLGTAAKWVGGICAAIAAAYAAWHAFNK